MLFIVNIISLDKEPELRFYKLYGVEWMVCRTSKGLTSGYSNIDINWINELTQN